jgi:hypothetical protein
VELKKVIMVEVAAVVVVLIIVMTLVEVVPYLAASEQNTAIGVYNEKTFAKGNLTLTKGTTVESTRFNYTVFDPAILVLDLNFQTWRSPGNLTVSVNGKDIANIYASPQNPQVKLTAITFSGKDLVEPITINSPFISNVISFSSKTSQGYDGAFSYQISIRGSR